MKLRAVDYAEREGYMKGLARGLPRLCGRLLYRMLRTKRQLSAKNWFGTWRGWAADAEVVRATTP